jgi:predicted ATPase/DNA-binding SARP family transcriptional activator
MQEADPLRVAILGPLEVSGEVRGPVEVPGRRLRALLIRLALEPGWVVSADRLIGDLWRGDPPAGAPNALQALVSRLRAVLGRSTIESGGGGYRLSLPADAVDLVRFERGVRRALGQLEAGRPGEAVRLLREALGLWRGGALADVEGEPFADAVRAGLEEQRVAAVEHLVEAVLAASAAADVGALLPELEQLRAAYPLREGLHGRYMKVLYALGRQAEALAAYEQLRQTLAEALGVDPSPEMAKLHLAMLRQDPQLPSFAAKPMTAATSVTALGAAVPDTAGPDTSASASGARFTSQTSVGQAAVSGPVGSTAADSGSAASEPAASTPAFSDTAAARSGAAASSPSAASSPAAGTPPRAGHQQGNLPAQLTSFIGREAELECVAGLLADARLVTLIGPGGAGKTRLAQESGSRMVEQVPDGVWFVPLAAVADGGDVAQAVLAALGGDDSLWLSAIAMDRLEPMAAAERVQAMLAGRSPVLILDNCEHVLDDVAELVDRILAAAPHARVLATSREPLALTGETLCPVASLALPPDPAAVHPPATGIANSFATTALTSGSPAVDTVSGVGGVQASGADPTAAKSDGSATSDGAAIFTGSATFTGSAAPTGSATAAKSAAAQLAASDRGAARLTDGSPAAESALCYAAVRLLAERARAVRPGFLVTASNVSAVVRICRSLDGIPLAIELAAARLRSLTAQQVADRLDDRFRLLTSGSRTALPRHQTLRAIVDWSWELLGPTERTALARLSVFAGGATPEAVAYVCADVSEEVIDVIASLVDKSLVVAQEDEAGDVRYRLLETVRAYAAERLEESDEVAAVRDAHAQHFLALAELADTYLRGREQLHWSTRLNVERDNLNAALRHVVAGGDVESALRYFQALTWFWMMRNHESDATQWATEVGELLDRVGHRVPEELREAEQICTGMLRVSALIRERPNEVGVIAESLLDIVPPTAVRARHPILAMARPVAGILTSRGLESSESQAELDALAEHPDPWVRAARLSYAGLVELHNARPEQAEKLLGAGYAAFTAQGDRLGLTFTLVMLTEFSLARGRFREALLRAQEAYRYASDGLSDDSGSIMLIKVGQARALTGEVEAGRRLMAQAAANAERLGEFGEAASGHSELAALALRLGDRAEARRRLARAAELIDAQDDSRRAGFVGSTLLARRAHLAALDGEFEVARGLLREAVELVRNGPPLSFMAGLDEIVRGLAALAGLQGDHMRAAELLGSAFSVVGMDNLSSYSGPATRSAALAALGEEAFAKAYERGRRLQKSELLALEP